MKESFMPTVLLMALVVLMGCAILLRIGNIEPKSVKIERKVMTKTQYCPVCKKEGKHEQRVLKLEPPDSLGDDTSYKWECSNCGILHDGTFDDREEEEDV